MYKVEVKKLDNYHKFTEAADAFKELGYYTAAPKGTKEYKEYWEEQLERSINGYLTEDGEYITGYFYFYLNFCPILRTTEKEYIDKNGLKYIKKKRERDFPSFYDYDRSYFDAVEAAERSGKHLAVIKKRAAGYSFKNASMLCRNFYCVKDSKSFAIASEMEFLTKDGLLSKAWDYMDFIDQNTAFFKKRQKVDTKIHKKASIVKDVDGVKTEIGYRSEIMGISMKNDPQKAHPYSQIVYTKGGPMKWKDVTLGTKLFAPDGTETMVIDVIEFGEGDVYEIKFNDGRIVHASLDHEWEVYRWNRGIRQKLKCDTRRLIKILKQKSSTCRPIQVKLARGVMFKKQDIPLDAYTLGLMLGDGSIGKSTNNQSHLTMMHEDVDAISEFIPFETIKYYTGPTMIRNVISIPNGRDIYKKLDLFDKKAGNKFIPDIYKYNTEEIRFGVVNGLLDTDGSVTKDYGVIEYSTKSRQLAEDFIWIIRSLGIGGKITSKFINGVEYYRCYVYCTPEETRLFNLKRKKDLIKVKKNNSHAKNKREWLQVKSIEYSHKEKLKCVTVDSKSSLYLIGDFITTVNSRGKRANLILLEEGGRFPNVKTTWQVLRPSVEDDDGKAYGTMIIFGTGGVEDSSFDGLKEIFYEPEGYNCLPIENEWDEGVLDKACGFFVPQYMNMYGENENGIPFMDENGNSNIKVAIDFSLEERKKVVEGATDRSSIDRFIAERPFTPQEACLEISSNIFPKKELIRHLADIRNSVAMREYKQVGDLVWQSDGTVKWELDPSKKDIVRYKIKPGESKEGSIVIWEHPEDNPPFGLYVAGCDPYDHDKSTTNSLGSFIIYKRYQNFEKFYDLPVAEYTGRPETAEEFYENCRKLAKYYGASILYENEKKGLFTYFQQKHCEYMLADQPGTIKDVIKDSKVQRGKGIHMNKEIKMWGEGLIKEYLNEEFAPGQKNLLKIYSEPLLEELINYNDTGNFDRVMAFMMVMIYREELFNMQVKKKKEYNRDKMIFDGPVFTHNL
jgi:hypothetical protein